jgi:hypothetical protein
VLSEQDEQFYAFYRDLKARLSQLWDQADSLWEGYPSEPPVPPLDSLLELLAIPAPAAWDEYSAMAVHEFVSAFVGCGFGLCREQRYRLASVLIEYTKRLPAEATRRVGDVVENICELIKRLPSAEQSHLVREMCESNGGWHLQSLAHWLAERPGSFYCESEDGKTMDELDQQFVALLRSMPIVRESLEAASLPTAPEDVRCFAPGALKRLDGG